ncbi:transglycosylase domain-containing protein [Sutcliffiella rhizosphaerae]|uniref:Penicillin-binding protein 1F n=1 Tax=Sutcliffiella rhizosphaerae TaxID=2880967 RepID=A0ABN8AFR5_9BACI|nr:PBP1A family penicillin-binding protein [Sutcliffiella rhizosphaerae]CAG9621715.1 Penicillin-binding protein 1F [Sutcliffiella rhizosphaerae]
MAERVNTRKPLVSFRALLLIGGLLALIILIGMQIYINSRDVSALTDPLPQSSVIYDRHGEVASRITSNQIEGVSSEDIPDIMKQAVVAVEDQRFYEHDGFDFVGTVRALATNVKAGSYVQGGSTITQQLAKNVFLSHDKTLKRKADEFFLAKKVEKAYSKDQIISLYLNQIYFGEGAWGIKRAAAVYFAKDPKELTLSEAATLAGLIKAPSALSPLNNEERSVQRRNLVLHLMYEQGFITADQVEEAKQEELKLETRNIDPYKAKYPSFTDYIIEEAERMYGISESEILAGGFRIYTTLEPKVQEALEKVYEDPENFPSAPNGELAQSSGVLLDPKTGGILGMIGGRDYQYRDFNRASRLKKPPGSTAKPLLVYTPALEEGYDIYDMLNDSPTEFGEYAPQNHTLDFRGEVSMYDAVLQSYNVPAVSLLYDMGIQKGMDAAKKLYLPVDEKEDRKLGNIALGGFYGVSPKHMAEAYSVYANNGELIESHAIVKIETVTGEEVAAFKEEKERVFSENAVEKMNFMLKGVVEEGSGKNAIIDGREVAGKTGSTQTSDNNHRATSNQWFVGYTPQIVGAFWIGFDKESSENVLPIISGAGSPSAKVFQQVVSEALKGEPKESFNLPSSLKKKINQDKNQQNQENEQRNEKKEEEKQRKKKEKEQEKKRKKEEKKREKEKKKEEKEQKKKKGKEDDN